LETAIGSRPDAGQVLWAPPADVRQTTEIGRYLQWLEHAQQMSFDGYDALWRWSVEDQRGFWESLWRFFEVTASAPYDTVLSSDAMPGAHWFPGARLNYAEHLLGTNGDHQRVAVIARSQTRPAEELTFAALRDQVTRARVGLQRLGIRPGDRVAAYLPNIPETLVAFAATASIGAVWASCAP
jgi:acetoacetyl-CoA synthetase